jgi:hypothetical protein
VQQDRDGNGAQLRQHPKFTEVPPLIMERDHTFSDILDIRAQTLDVGIHSNAAELNKLMNKVHIFCYSNKVR